MAVFTPSDRPTHKLVRNHCVIKVFRGDFFGCQFVFCIILCWYMYKGFCHMTKCHMTYVRSLPFFLNTTYFNHKLTFVFFLMNSRHGSTSQSNIACTMSVTSAFKPRPSCSNQDRKIGFHPSVWAPRKIIPFLLTVAGCKTHNSQWFCALPIHTSM